MSASQPVEAPNSSEASTSSNDEDHQTEQDRRRSRNKTQNSIYFALVLAALTFLTFGFTTALILFIPYQLLIRNKKWIYILYMTLPRDMK